MRRRIYLHIGSHKTGTTAVQSWLNDNSGALEDAGVLVPESGRNTNLANSRALAQALAMPKGEGHPGFAELRAAFRDEIAANPDKDILISAEYFSLILTQPKMNTVRKRLEYMGLEPVTALVLRNPIDLINSAYAQRCKTLRGGEDFAAFLQDFFGLERGNWPLRLRRLEALSLNPKLATYIPGATDSPRQVMKLFDLDTRLDKKLFRKSKQENSSIGELGVLSAYILRRAMGNSTPRPNRAARDWLSSLLTEMASEHEIRAFNGLTPQQVRNIELKSRPQLEALADKHLAGDAEALVTSYTGPLGQSPLNVEGIPGQLLGKVQDVLSRTLEVARAKPAFATHFPTDPFLS